MSELASDWDRLEVVVVVWSVTGTGLNLIARVVTSEVGKGDSEKNVEVVSECVEVVSECVEVVSECVEVVSECVEVVSECVGVVLFECETVAGPVPLSELG